MIVSEASDDIYKSIDLAVTKLDHMLHRRSRLKKVKRKHPHEIDIPAEILKIEPAESLNELIKNTREIIHPGFLFVRVVD